jgi:hypothetical protein
MKFDPCPLCDKEVQAYTLGTYGLIRCWPCGLRLECDGGLKAAQKKWNRSQAAPEDKKPVESLKTPSRPTTLEDFVTQQIGGAWYVSDRVIKKRSGTKIKQSDYERYEKLWTGVKASTLDGATGDHSGRTV